MEDRYIGRYVTSPVDGLEYVVKRFWSDTPEKTYICESEDGTVQVWLFESEIVGNLTR